MLKELILIGGSFGNRIKESYIRNNHLDEWIKINKFCEDNGFQKFKWKRKVYHYIFEITIIPQCPCGKECNFRGRINNIYTKYCGISCSKLFDKDRIKNLIKNNISKYGVSNVFQLESVKLKSKETNISRYGVDNPNKNKEVREKIEKTNLKKYGYKSSLSSEEVRKKSKITNLEKYGVDHPMKNTLIKNKLKLKFKEKYGVDNPNKNEEFRISNFDLSENYIQYIGNKVSLYKCDLGLDHVFEIHKDLQHTRRRENNPLCTVCYPISKNVSIKEIELRNFIKSIYHDKIIISYRDGTEIDIYLPDLKIGFEFNGLYYHSNLFKDNNYHKNKTDYFKSKGIDVFHIWEDDWVNKKEIVKSMIKNRLGIIDSKIYARKCIVVEVDSENASKFIDNNHIQGSSKSSIRLGLMYNGKLVSIMTFDKFEGRNKLPDNEWNLNRFCSILNTVVIGGFSKILNYLIKNKSPRRIISYADKSWSSGHIYRESKFNTVSEIPQDYKYIIKNKRVHKSRFRKSKTGISESKLDLLKIYDCGKIKFSLSL